ncbi:MAG TPA: glycosyltransferase, partial [Solirubrobacteraceae bacterium]|nr:glycosyltransferase [Solirubrobacteraceae bacterium]
EARPAPASVLICSRERPALLGDTVRSVLAGAVVPAELVIVDQSAEVDRELAALGDVRGCRVRYVHSSTAGLSRARNVGLRTATSEVAVMLDDDMLVDERWLSELLAGRPAAPRALATGRVLAAPPEGDAGIVPPAALVERDTPAVYRGPQAIDVVPGANVALPRELALEVGGYDERLGAGTRFGAADDNDMGYRLLRAGCEVHHVPSAIALHRAWRSRSELLRLRWRYARGKGAFYAKHAERRDRHIRARAGADIARRVRRAARSVPTSPRTTAAELISLAGMASGAVDWIVTQRALGRRRGRSA